MNATKLAAAQYRRDYPGLEGGVVLVSNGAAYGWKDALRDPQSECPGVYAVDADGRVFVAKGGNNYDGAKRWEGAQ